MGKPLTPYIRRAWYSSMPPGELINERVIFDYEIVYIKEGNAVITVENNTYSAQVGDFFVFRPHQRHSIHVSSKGNLIQPHVHFDLLYRKDRAEIPISFKSPKEISASEEHLFHPDILDDFIPHFPTCFHPHSARYIELMLFDLIHEYENPSVYSEIRLSFLFLRLWEQVLNEINCNFDNPKSQKENHAAKIKLFIEHHVSSALDMEELANLTHFSQGHIFRLFRETYDTSPLQYHALIRIQKAKSMIQNTNMSITEISKHLGFTSVQDFCRVFKKVDGYAPSTYRLTKLSD